MRKLFLVGSPRSGTTLLQTILTSQSELFTLKETHFFRHLHRWRPVRWLDHLHLDGARVDAAFRFITENNALEGSYDWAGVRRLADACRLFDHLMTNETGLRDRRGWLEKTPEHMFFIDEIRRYLPNARFVHILRDGPDVVAVQLVDAARDHVVVERALAAVAHHGREHAHAAHEHVDRRPERVVVEERAPRGEEDPTAQLGAPVEDRGDREEVEERPVVRDQEDAVLLAEPGHVLEADHVEPARPASVDERADDQAVLRGADEGQLGPRHRVGDLEGDALEGGERRQLFGRGTERSAHGAVVLTSRRRCVEPKRPDVRPRSPHEVGRSAPRCAMCAEIGRQRQGPQTLREPQVL